jgi:hypothetical protein
MKYYYVEPNYFATSDLVFTDAASLNNFLNYTKYSCTVKVRQTKENNNGTHDNSTRSAKGAFS